LEKHLIITRKRKFWDFPGSPMVKTLPSSARDVGSIPVREAKSPHALQTKKKKKKTENRNNIV